MQNNDKPNANMFDRQEDYNREFSEWEKTLLRINKEFTAFCLSSFGEDGSKFNRDEEIE